jgi:UDP-GalNAc:undecaprenyl-phosphate GalNAc-1-phosphate transferase
MEFRDSYSLYNGNMTNTRFIQQQLFYPLLLWYVVGLAFVILPALAMTLKLSPIPVTAHQFFHQHPFLIIGVTLAFLLSVLIVEKTNHFPGWNSAAIVLPAVSSMFLLLICLLLIGRLYYARSFLLTTYFLTIIWLVVGLHIRRRFFKPRLAVVPFGDATALTNISRVYWHVLSNPALSEPSIHAVVVDLHADLPVEWQRFLADCALHRVPVYHSRWVSENIDGRVSLDHLSEGLLISFGPPPAYPLIKRSFDLLAVVISLPIVIPIMLFMALAIKLDSRGPVFFVQKRVGREDKVFRMIKFRSMYPDSESTGAQFADEMDCRVTRVGKLMRRFRLDELPQILNILMGHMSLVGPRPEQICFVAQFEREIPFYSYRHSVRPGITGWAQVTHGYAADTEATTEKLERDIFYIKYMSFWLDFSILVRTFRILFTGYGAR